AGGAEFHLVESGRWDLTMGFEGVSREFRNVPAGLTTSTGTFFEDGNTADTWLAAHRALLRIPERRFTLDGKAEFPHGEKLRLGFGCELRIGPRRRQSL